MRERERESGERERESGEREREREREREEEGEVRERGRSKERRKEKSMPLFVSLFFLYLFGGHGDLRGLLLGLLPDETDHLVDLALDLFWERVCGGRKKEGAFFIG